MPPRRGRGRGAKASSSTRTPSKSTTEADPDGQATAGAETEDVQMLPVSSSPVEAASAMQQEQEPITAEQAISTPSSSATGARPSPTSQQVNALRSSRSGAPSPRGAGLRRTITPKFSSRRSKEERDAILRAEEARQARQNADQEEERKRQERMASFKRGRGSGYKRGQGRGGYIGGRQASGPFSLGSVQTAKAKAWVPHRKMGVSKKSESKRRIKKEGEDGEAGVAGSSRDAADMNVKQEHGTYISSDEEYEDDEYDVEGRKKDIDFINLVSDDEEDAAGWLPPVRVRRVDHKDRFRGITPEPTSGPSKKQPQRTAVSDDEDPAPVQKKGKQRLRDIEVLQSTRVWRGVYDDQDVPPPSIKPEPSEDVEMGDIDAAPSVPDAALPPPDQLSRVKKGKGQRRPGAEKRPIFQTVEEEQEYVRHAEELITLREELGTIDITDSADTTPAAFSKQETVYLFQFPPVLPDLNPLSENVKSEKDDNDVAIQSEHIDLTSKDKGKARIKAEQVEVKPDIKVDPDAQSSKTKAPRLTSGNVGKLRVHKSGKVTLDWGGTSLELHLGMQASFLEDAVLTRTPASGEPTGTPGEAWALGPVKGKFVMTPDWDEILG